MKPIFASLALLGLAGLSFVTAENFTVGSSTTTVNMATANVGTVTITNPITSLNVGTIFLSNGVSSVALVTDANTNIVVSRTSTNDLDAIQGKATILSHYMGTDTNLLLSAIGGQPLNTGLSSISSASTYWGSPVVSDGANAVYLPITGGFRLFEDFLSFVYGADVGGSMNWIYDLSAGGTATNAPGTAANPGQLALSITVTGGSRSGIGSGGFAQESILFGGGVWYEEMSVKVSALSDGTDTYRIRMGFGDVRYDADFVDGIYFRYNDAVNSGNWEGVCSSNSVRTAVDIGLAPSTSAFQRMGIFVAADGSSVKFYTNGVVAVTNTLNIPIGARTTGPCVIGITRTAGTSNARAMWLDYVYLWHKLTTPR